jgi:hypothetical protein
MAGYEDPGVAWTKVAESIMALAKALDRKAAVDEKGLKFDMQEAGYDTEDDETCQSSEPTDAPNADSSTT